MASEAPRSEPVAPATGPTSIAIWSLRSDRLDIQLEGRTVLGRAPVVEPTFAPAVAIRVDDPERTVSKTHAIIEPAVGVCRVTDLRSTNGVRIERADGSSTDLASGASEDLADGDVVALGEYRFTVVGPARSNVYP
ncbi:FHA domain-containing protein [Agromyces protaetiae]|uniref:FHA domain-containing protein n=1 Tax=Agromyces protaetiae TaxID=2509455 RepID=UPI0013EC2DCB|nr:FHA domain-containing protein [Agromyces protaetiae]